MEQLDKVCKALGQGFGNGVGNAISFQYPGMEKKHNVTTLLGDALALIRQQQERIKELEAGQQWISVKDRLPERPENWPHCEIKRCYFLVALESGCVKSLGFDFADMRWHTAGSPVTHWMPLPEPPKEEA